MARNKYLHSGSNDFGRLFATDSKRVFVMMAPMVLSVCALGFEGLQSEVRRQWTIVLGFIYPTLNFEWLKGDNAWFANVAAIIIFVAVLQSANLDYKKLFA